MRLCVRWKVLCPHSFYTQRQLRYMWFSTGATGWQPGSTYPMWCLLLLRTLHYIYSDCILSKYISYIENAVLLQVCISKREFFFFLLNWFFMELQHICRHFWSSCETVWRQKRETKTDCKNLMLAPRCLFAEKRRSEDFLAFRVSPKPVSVLEADISARITEMGEELFSGTSRGLWVDWTALLYMHM